MPAAARAPGRSRSCPQSASTGASLEAPALVTLAPGGRAELPVAASATAQAAAGDDYGFLVLRRGAETRRIPYAFFVTRPALQDVSPIKLRRFQNGTTAGGASRVESYRWPAAPFGYPPNITDPPVVEDGAERVYLVPHLDRPVVNLGVSVVSAENGAVIDPWLLGSLDENDVQGEAGTPVDVNPLTFDFGLAIGAAATVFPRLQRFYVSVDSAQDVYTGKPLRGRYRLRYWVNDLRPPKIRLLTRRVAAGRPTLAVQSPGHRRRSRSLLAAGRLQDGRPRCDCLRLELGRRHLCTPIVRAAAASREDARGLRRIGLPGGEEHHELRPQRDAEHDATAARASEPCAGRRRRGSCPGAAAACTATRDCWSWPTRRAASSAVRFLDGKRRYQDGQERHLRSLRRDLAGAGRKARTAPAPGRRRLGSRP